jgi:hypothetical protein
VNILSDKTTRRQRTFFSIHINQKMVDIQEIYPRYGLGQKSDFCTCYFCTNSTVFDYLFEDANSVITYGQMCIILDRICVFFFGNCVFFCRRVLNCTNTVGIGFNPSHHSSCDWNLNKQIQTKLTGRVRIPKTLHTILQNVPIPDKRSLLLQKKCTI